MSATLLIKPKKGNFLKNYDTFNKMDPFVTITIGTNSQKSDVAHGQGKTPVWTKVLTFQVPNFSNDLAITFEAHEEDIKSNEFLGKQTTKISQLKTKAGEINTITLVDNKNNSIGTIDVEIEVKQGTSASKQPIGTVIIKPVGGKFNPTSGIVEGQKMYLVISHGDVAYQTSESQSSRSKPSFQDALTFQLFENEDMIVSCFDIDPKKEEMIGEGQIKANELTKRGRNTQETIVQLFNIHNKIIGELSMELEIIPDVFNNPVKAFPVVEVKKGEHVSKKIKYSNPDKVKKQLRIKADNANLIFVKTETVSINPGEVGEIRVRFLAPAGDLEQTCKIDVVTEDNRVEESLLFKVKAI